MIYIKKQFEADYYITRINKGHIVWNSNPKKVLFHNEDSRIE